MLRGIKIDANAAVIITVIGPWNKIITYYSTFSLEAIAAMPREFETNVDR